MFKSSVILHRWSDRWLSHLVVPSSLGISAMLLANVGITGLFIDSYYRYDFSLLLLKFMLAGIGIAIFLNFLKPLAAVGAAFQRVPGGATLPPYHGWAVTAGQRVSVIAWTPVQATDRAIRRSWSRVRIELRDSAREWRTALGIVVVSLGGLALLIYAFWETDNAAQAPAATATSTRTAPPSPASQAPPVLDLPKTELADLPGLPAGQQWHLIWGLNAAPLQIAPVVAGQTALQLVATRTDERHAIAAHFRDPDASAPTTGYRFTVWLKAESAVNAQIMVRDPVNPQTGKPGKEREIRFDLASSSVLSANDNSATQTIVRDSRDWQKLQIDLPTAHREVFIYVGMLENGSNSHVFRGTGQRLIFGGFEISRR
jgi:energy-coupling factor transporter transmembrane protein EcfT